jgi:hypothetical protein
VAVGRGKTRDSFYSVLEGGDRVEQRRAPHRDPHGAVELCRWRPTARHSIRNARATPTNTVPIVLLIGAPDARFHRHRDDGGDQKQGSG